jgi:two-component system NtrC family sensor kinase
MRAERCSASGTSRATILARTASCRADLQDEVSVATFLRFGTLGTRLGLVTSAAILVVSLAFFGWRYTSETELLTDQFHEHMGENVAALTASLQRIDTASEVQAALEEYAAAVQRHVHEFGHEHREGFLVLVYATDGRVLASTERQWIGRGMPADLLALAAPAQGRLAGKFRTVQVGQARYLSLAEPLDARPDGSSGGQQRILYLEPYSRVTRLSRGSLLRNLAFSLLLAAILAVTVNFLVRRMVIARLQRLAGSMERVEREGLEAPVPELGRDELGEVRDVYARTLAELRRSRQAIELHARTLETQVQERTAQLLRAHRLAAIGELAAGLAHGLNNPLASIAASAEKLLDLTGRDAAQLQKRLPDHLQRIVRNTDRCKHIAQSLLSFARENRTTPRPIQPSAVLREAVAVVEAEAEARKVEIRLAGLPALPIVNADPEALTQVIVNLLSNALDASAPGGSVELEAAVEAAELVLAVVDHGTGIDPEHLEQIFRPFFTTKPPGSGTGLGLSICHGIVEQLGGRIAVESRPGQGSRFEVRLPLGSVPGVQP